MNTARQRSYPHGVPCWVDRTVLDLEAATSFYSDLFGWGFDTVTPPDASFEYRVASLDGQAVAAVGAGEADTGWSTYVAVDDVHATAAAVAAAGGTVETEAQEVGPAGSLAVCRDPAGARFLLWQPGQRLGAALVNAPNTWNFSNLRVADLAAVRAFYESVFGWHFAELPDGAGQWIQVPGYGQHLADTVDPEIFERQADAPAGFADVVAGVEPAGPEIDPIWSVVFTVADRDAAAGTAQRLGGVVLAIQDSTWTKTARVSDPHGGSFTLSQFTPPS